MLGLAGIGNLVSVSFVRGLEDRDNHRHSCRTTSMTRCG